MAYSAEVIAHSISPVGDELYTVEGTFPRMVLAEFNTHRMFSRNSASSRAIPVEKQLTKILDDPFIPIYWGANKPGMQATEELSEDEQHEAERLWLQQRDIAMLGACALTGGVEPLKDESLKDRILAIDEVYEFGLESKALETPLHKQSANRILEPYMWHTVIVTATEWNNFFGLRLDENAQPEIRKAAQYLGQAMIESTAKLVDYDEWHLPYVQPDEFDLPIEDQIRISVGRCARVSYETHDGIRDIEKDLILADRLHQGGHMSPYEHPATPSKKYPKKLSYEIGNLRGWEQARKRMENESDYIQVLKENTKNG